MSLVSVIIPAYNADRYLSECLLSIVNQTLRDIEIIVVNDGSQDNTKNIIDRFAALDSRIKPVNQKNSGVTVALNKGIALATSTYIARMDADDISAVDRLEKQYLYLQAHPECTLLGTEYEVIDIHGNTLSETNTPNLDDDIRIALRLNSPFAHGSVMYRRSDFKAVGGYRKEAGAAEDYDLWIRLAERGKLFILEDILFKWRLGDNNITTVNSSGVEKGAASVRKIMLDKQLYLTTAKEIADKKKTYNKARYDKLLENYSQLSIHLLKAGRVVDGFKVMKLLLQVGKEGRHALADRVIRIVSGGRKKLKRPS